VIVPTSQHNQTIGNQILVDPRTDTLYDVFDWLNNTGSNGPGTRGANVAFIKSTDGGATWTQPQIVAALETVGVANTRTGDIIPEAALDPATGRLYAVWQDSRFNGGKFDEVAISTSADGGATWSAPARVNDATGQPAFTAAVAVNSVGAVAVSYYQYVSQSATALPTNYLLKTSSNQGASFGVATTLKGPFDMTIAPDSEGFFVGDYEGLTAVGTGFQPFFVATNTGNTSNRTDVFTTGT
jgi:Neuraminidase (sialidase)